MENVNSNFVIQHCLHGYKNGHSLIANSNKMPKQTSSLILRMSDAATIGYTAANPSYLTGYPLPEIGAYALARTWGAENMPRPGCVWTHTLIIDFAHLAKFQDFDVLERVFKNPNNALDFDYYENTIELNESIHSAKIKQYSPSLISTIVQTQYLSVEETTILPVQEFVDTTVLKVWSQQWPKLRRHFKFRTYTNISSSLIDFFDLCFTERKITANISHLMLNEDDLSCLNFAVENIIKLENGPFKDFLWRYGADSGYLRESYIPLIKVWIYLSQSKKSTAIRAAWNILLKWPRLSKSLEVLLLVKTSELESDEFTSDFVEIVFNSLLSLKKLDVITNIKAINKLLIILGNDKAYSFLMANIEHIQVFGTLTTELPVKIILFTLTKEPLITTRILEIRPNLLHDDGFLKLINSQPELLINYIRNNEQKANTVVAKCIELGLIEALILLIDEFELGIAETLFNKIDYVKELSVRNKIIEYLVTKKDFIYGVFLSSTVVSFSVLNEISYRVNVSDYINSERDPWISALLKVDVCQLASHEAFNIFLYKRSLKSQGIHAAALIFVTFDIIHSAIAANSLSRVGWKAVEETLPLSKILKINDWDKCRRLRRTVVGYYLRNKLPVELFIYITTNDKTLNLILDEVGKFKFGRQFLSQLLSYMDYNNINFDEGMSLNRSQLLAHLFKV